ncbi:hypothetical protein BGZ58_003914 [Dissophora ornata]|nr:hypothetical protein BGZ58_003914 [Dissophora ornata]
MNDPPTPRPSFSGAESIRMGKPAFCITHDDQKASVRLFRRLLEGAKAYREQMLKLAETAADFGNALEEIARSKAAVRDTSGVSSSLQSAAGLHFVMSNHHHILHKTFHRLFEIPLTTHLDTHVANIEACEAQYERLSREQIKKLRETEAISFRNGRKGLRDPVQHRQDLEAQQMYLDELERLKLEYYFDNLEGEQANLQQILEKTSTIVRAEMEIYERIVSKGVGDPILEIMVTQEPDPFCTYSDQHIFSALPAIPFIANVGAPQMGLFYGHHDPDPFPRAGRLDAPRDPYLFGDVTSDRLNFRELSTAAATTSSNGHQSTLEVTPSDAAEQEQLNQAFDTETSMESSNSTSSSETAIQSLIVRDENESDLNAAVAEDTDEAEEPTTREPQTPQASADSSSEQQDPVASSSAVDLRNGQVHHRHQTESEDGISHASSSPAEPTPSHHLVASSPDSPPVRSFHISQDLLNNSEFSYSHEPSEQRSLNSQLNISGGSNNTLQVFGGFGDLEGDEGFRATSSTALHQHQTNNSQVPLHQHTRDRSSSQSYALRHHSSDGHLSGSASTSLSISNSSYGVRSIHNSRSTGRLRRDYEETASTSEAALEDPFSPSTGQHAEGVWDVRRGFDGGMPAFNQDEADDWQVSNIYRRSMTGLRNEYNNGRESGSDQDSLERSFTRTTSNTSVESVQMADGSSRDVSATNLNAMDEQNERE